MIASKVFGLIPISFIHIELSIIHKWPHLEISGAKKCSYWLGSCLLPVIKLYREWSADFLFIFVCVDMGSRGNSFPLLYNLQ